MHNPVEFAIEIGGKTILFQAGHVAQQANGAVMVTMGGTVVLSSVCASPNPKEGASFFPLTVDYRERNYAMGRIPGGFFRREGRPKESEILASRLTDRSLRPLFPEGFYHEVTVQSLVLSSDGENDADILTLLASSAALTMSDIPFSGPVACVRVARIGGEFVFNPTFAELETSDIEVVVSATKDAYIMVEGGAKIVPEEVILQALRTAQKPLERLCEIQDEIRKKIGKAKFSWTPFSWNAELKAAVTPEATPKVQAMLKKFLDKKSQDLELGSITKAFKAKLEAKFPDHVGQVGGVVHDIYYAEARAMLVNDGVRADGRKPDEIRNITCMTSVLPRTHGSAIFKRGQTQALVTVTLGTPKDTQQMEDLEGDYRERFLFHYNFPAFSVGEIRPDRGPGRREIGHGSLARRSLLPLVPKEEDFPYTVRVVSDILESNGSTSMASVCGGSLAMFDAGVPMEDHVAGIAMGLILENGRPIVLTDIMGLEDHLGDMDFKLAGTRNGVTGFQMDVKVPGLTFDILNQAVEQARHARLAILDKMIQALTHPRSSLSLYAPKMVVVSIPVEKIGALIGPGGKNIRRMSETYSVEIEVEDDGRVFLHAKEWESVEQAKREIEAMTQEPEIGKIYKGKVVSITDFGAFVEIMPGRDGLLHVSQMAEHPVNHPSDLYKEGDEVEVKIVDIDSMGKIRLSRKAILVPGSEFEDTRARRPDGGGDAPRRHDGPRGFGLRPPRFGGGHPRGGGGHRGGHGGGPRGGHGGGGHRGR
ncbi:MAG: polyribonucleotide nucleotidyltransferase [Elusimicrobia bacterium]|nr:polyribonucleotide nucleotidyltransferase [Elusimicrobiota bacterium]